MEHISQLDSLRDIVLTRRVLDCDRGEELFDTSDFLIPKLALTFDEFFVTNVPKSICFCTFSEPSSQEAAHQPGLTWGEKA